MNIEVLKNKIENKEIISDLIIFQLSDNDFIARQYIKAITDINQLPIQHVDNISDLYVDDIFSTCDNSLKLLKVSSFECFDENLKTAKNAIIIADKIPLDCAELFNDYIVRVPKLEKWHIKDFAFSMLEAVDKNNLEWLLELCNYDIYRVSNEVDKLKLFKPHEQNILFEDIIQDNGFGDLSKETIYDFTNAIMKKDFKKLAAIYDNIENIDIEAIGVVTILLKSFLDVIKIQLTAHPTAAALGIDQKRFYAISRNNLNRYNRGQLLNIYELLTSIDKRIKTGEMPVNILRDYLVLKILSI